MVHDVVNSVQAQEHAAHLQMLWQPTLIELHRHRVAFSSDVEQARIELLKSVTY